MRSAALIALAVVACTPRLPPLPMPVGLMVAPPESAVRWADSSRPLENRDIRFRFLLRDEEGSYGGSGRARLALPDSIRFDLRGSLGAARASAFVLGDSAQWTEPEERVRNLVPNYPLFWAMLGIARPPPRGSAVRGFADSVTVAWQFAAGGDTVEYVRERGANPRLIAEARQNGKRIGRVETKFGPDGFPVSSRLIVPKPASRLDLTFHQHTKAAPFAPDTWLRPAPQP